MDGDDHESQTSADEHENLPCLNCGYYLRGLTGDPVRCPECGAENSRADLLLPPALVEKELRKLETLPTLAAGTGFVILFGVYLMSSGFHACALTLLAAALSIWILAVFSFGDVCGYKTGWVNVVLWYHWAGLCFVATIVVLGVLLFKITSLLPERWKEAYFYILLVCLAVGPTIAKRFFEKEILWGINRNPYSRAKEGLRVLARGLAVERAKLLQRQALKAKRPR